MWFRQSPLWARLTAAAIGLALLLILEGCAISGRQFGVELSIALFPARSATTPVDVAAIPPDPPR